VFYSVYEFCSYPIKALTGTVTRGDKTFPKLWHFTEWLVYFHNIFYIKKGFYFVQNVVPGEFGHRDNNFRTINY
jgi:hypothetical protein